MARGTGGGGGDYFKYFRPREAIDRGMAIIRGNKVSFSSALRLGHNPSNNQQWWFIYNQGSKRESPKLEPGAWGEARDSKWSR